MRRDRNPNEIRCKAYCLDSSLLRAFKEKIRSTYSKSSVSRVIGPGNDGSYWIFLNIYPEKTREVS